MSQSSTEARETAATTATALSLDSKTESKLKIDSKTKSESKGKINSKSKSDSGSKSEMTTTTKIEFASKEKAASEVDKMDSKTKTKSESTSKIESVGKVGSKTVVDRSRSKTATQSSQSKSKSDTGSKEAATPESGAKVESIGKVSTETVGKVSTETANKAESISKLVTDLKSQSKTESASKPESISKVSTETVNKAESISKLVTYLKSQSKTESASKPESLVNKVDSDSQVESANNVELASGVATASKTKSESASKPPERRTSTDSGQDMEAGHNPQSPASKSQDKQLPQDAAPKDATSESNTPEPAGEAEKSPSSKKTQNRESNQMGRSVILADDINPHILPTKNNTLYNTTAVLEKLDRFPTLKMRRDGKYYLKMKDIVVEQHPKVKRNKRGDVIPTIKKEPMGAVERIVSRFCEDVLCISRAQFLPLSSQGERHLVWVGKKKANHIIRYLNGNGCYVVNRFPGDIFMKDKQVMGIILRDHMLMRSNHCYWKCGVPKDDILNPKKKDEEEEEENPVTYRVCRHMVKTMHTDEEGCDDKGCYNFEKHTCKHLDIFIPEVQSFCTYNALQDFSNRLEDDLKGQTFICKPAYLFKGFGFRFFQTSAQFQEFYHMTEGKETSRHDFMVQRLVDRPFLFNNKKVDIRCFLLVVVLRYRRVISFIHYGFCRVANTEFEMNEEENEVKIEEPLSDMEIEKKKAEDYERFMQMFVCTYFTDEEKKDRAKRMETQTFYDEADDRSQELTAVFPKEEELQNVKDQIRHIGIRLSQAIENKVWDAFGCFQIFGLDMCVDEDMKVWLLEVNSHAMSTVDTLSPTQRKVVPAVIMEALGLVVETTYKSFHHLRLRKSPTNEFEETGFLFRQNYDFIFSTLAKKRMDYVWPKPPKKRDLPFYERIGAVDEQIKSVDRRKKACLAMKIAVREEQLALKRKRNAKDEEES